jgi:hypothetical protein
MRGLWAVYAHPALETLMVLSGIPEPSLRGSERKKYLFPVDQIVIAFSAWVIRSSPSP